MAIEVEAAIGIITTATSPLLPLPPPPPPLPTWSDGPETKACEAKIGMAEKNDVAGFPAPATAEANEITPLTPTIRITVIPTRADEETVVTMVLPSENATAATPATSMSRGADILAFGTIISATPIGTVCRRPNRHRRGRYCSNRPGETPPPTRGPCHRPLLHRYRLFNCPTPTCCRSNIITVWSRGRRATPEVAEPAQRLSEVRRYSIRRRLRRFNCSRILWPSLKTRR